MIKPITGKVLFVTTSPRTPAKLIPEIELLHRHFDGAVWNRETQAAYMELLREENFFHGKAEKNPAFSARDRMSRAPRSLGLVTLSPSIGLTPAGRELIQSDLKEEIFLRQLLKFQVPSPFHKPTAKAAKFWVKPYLELFRLIRHFGSLTFDEMRLFGLQLVDYRRFDEVVKKIEEFRSQKALYKGKYKAFYKACSDRVLEEIYADEIRTGKTGTRENKDKSLTTFLTTKARNMRDYTDACFRYLRFTGMVNISHVGKSISIVPEHLVEVDFFLKEIEREPHFIDDEEKYVTYLGDNTQPVLYGDNRKSLLRQVRTEFPAVEIASDATISQLKDILHTEIGRRKKQILENQVSAIKEYKFYEDIIEKYAKPRSLYDPPLMLEWNTWRAMTMLNGGVITANLKFDDWGNPQSTALGNMADIVCDYGDFMLTVEVTMQTKQRQYETEGEPVARHLAKCKKETGKPAYCLFIAPAIDPACVTHFYLLHKEHISYYQGNSVIIPLPLSTFQKMLENAYRAPHTPGPDQIRRFFELSETLARSSNCDTWYERITTAALNWPDQS